MHPFTFIACSYNLWGTNNWPQRQEPLRRFLQVHRPDIFCAQELTPAICETITEALPVLLRIDDAFPGWVDEGNIFWNSDLFKLVEYGAEDIDIIEQERRLFWVRLVRESGETLVVATAHFSWTGNPREMNENINVRVGQAQRATEVLDRLTNEREPVLFMGDFNDHIHPIRVLRLAGFDDSFSTVLRAPEMTYPAFPMTNQSQELLDWMMHRGPIRPVLTSVIDFQVRQVAPSDHKPVITSYVLSDGE
jgi:endonuclease/exonuclease/phosphatase family metal-dependent hydrolase